MSTGQEIHEERKFQEKMIKSNIYDKLVKSGEKERLKEVLRQYLMECGWHEEMKSFTKQVVKDRGTFEGLTHDELMRAITPKARDLVPDEIKEQMLHSIKEFIEKNDLVEE